jgi:hypothetical protein
MHSARGLMVPAALLAGIALTSCATVEPEPGPTTTSVEAVQTPTATPTPTVAADSADDIPPVPSVAAEVTFSFQCYEPPHGDVTQDFASMEDVWASSDAFISCRADKHGEIYTDVQHAAVAAAASVLPAGIEQLDSLYSQCAIRDNDYLGIGPLAANQQADVAGFLTICPHHPRADELRALL